MKPSLSAMLCVLPLGLLQAAPSNDNLADRIVLLGPNVSLTSSNVGATKETGETNHAAADGQIASGKSVWYSWTPGSSGYAEFTLTGAFNKVIAIYTGTALTNLTRTTSYSISSSYNALGKFNATAGTEYLVAVDGYNAASGSFALSVVLTPPPLNDNFADRIILAGTTVTTNGSNVGATREPGEPSHEVGTVSASVWWSWTPPAPGGRVTVSVTGDFYSMLGIYTGTAVSNLSFVANAYGSSGYPAKTVFDAVAGVAYQIAVDGIRPTDLSSNVTLQIALQPPPPNDNFANAATLTGTNLLLSLATNISATPESGEPNHASRVGGRSVWWNWAAPVSGHFVVLASGYFNKLLGVYTGDSVSALTEVASGYGTTNNLAQAGFDATAGTVYRIAVDGENGAAATFSLELRLPPLNDDFANRFTLAGTNVSVTTSNTTATKEPGEPNHAGNTGGKSLWWTWTAPMAGRVMVTSFGFSSVVAVYSGTNFASLTTNASGNGYGPDPAYANFDAVSGATYQVAVDGDHGFGGRLTLKLTYVTAPPSDNFADRMAVTNTTTTNVFLVTGSNLGATLEPGEFEAGRASVWWTWTAPANGDLLLELKTSGHGEMTSPWLIFCTGTTVSNLTRLVPYPEWRGTMYLHAGRYIITAGTTYSICVANRGVQGLYTLRGTFWTPPANDHFTNRVTLTNTPKLFDYGYMRLGAYNASATKETGEPSHCGPSCPIGGKSVWWTWTAPYSGRIEVVVDPIDYTFLVMASLYTGEAVNNLTRIATIYANGPGGGSYLTAPVSAGTTYQIAVDGGGSYGDSGAFELRLDAYFDTNAPFVTITNPLPGFATNAALLVSGTANDLLLGTGAFRYASGVKLVDVRLNGGAWQPATGTNAWSRALTLASGANRIEVRSRDHVGNESPLASVTVFFGTVISSVAMANGTLTVSFPTEVNKTYQLEFTTNLASPVNWQPVDPTPVSGTGQPLTLTDPDVAGQPQRFYRLRTQP